MGTHRIGWPDNPQRDGMTDDRVAAQLAIRIADAMRYIGPTYVMSVVPDRLLPAAGGAAMPPAVRNPIGPIAAEARAQMGGTH